MGDIAAYLTPKTQSITALFLNPRILAELFTLIEDLALSIAKLQRHSDELLISRSAKELVERKGPIQISDTDKAIIDQVGGKLERARMYRNGKTKLLGFFVGQVSRIRGAADPVRLINCWLRSSIINFRLT